MSEFYIWLTEGLKHILDLEGYDHICYVVALTVLYSFREWKKLLLLVTAFTVGHSLSLALSVLDIVKLPSKIIEIAIPITIIVTCLTNIYAIRLDSKLPRINYAMALCFGLIHGLGFSYLLKMMLGKEENITTPLLSFNVGLEVGQIFIVTIVLFLTWFAVNFIKIPLRYWITVISTIVLFIASSLLYERFI